MYVLFKPDRPNGIRLPGLPENVVPLKPHQTIKPFSIVVDSVRVSVARSQIRLLPCYAMTIAKCQGQNIKLSLADVSAPKTGARMTVNHLYVAFSRSSGLETFKILRNPPTNLETLLTQRISEYLRTDDARLNSQARDTRQAFGNGSLFDTIRFASEYDGIGPGTSRVTT